MSATATLPQRGRARARSTPRVWRGLSISSVLLRALDAAAECDRPPPPYHGGGPAVSLLSSHFAAIPEWCARKVDDVLSGAERAAIQAAVARAHANGDTGYLYDEWGEYRPPPVKPIRQTRRPDGGFLAELIEGVAERSLLRPGVLEPLAGKSAVACVRILGERAGGERVREFLVALDQELMRRELRTIWTATPSDTIRWRGNLDPTSRYLLPWYLIQYESGGQLMVLSGVGPHRVRIFEDGGGNALALLTRSDPAAAKMITGAIEAHTITRAIFEWLPARAPIYWGLLRLLCPWASSSQCSFCGDTIRGDGRRVWCRPCKETLFAALARPLPTPQMMLADIDRALAASDVTNRLSLLALVERDVRRAEARSACPWCRGPGDLVPTARGTLCRGCVERMCKPHGVGDGG